MHRIICLVALVLLTAIVSPCSLVAHATEMPGGDPLLNPKTYTSPSGAFALTVVPDNPNGSGGAAYTMRSNGSTVWEGKRDFTLWNAGVTDTGVVGGVAYSEGEGATMTFNGPGTISAVILAPDGSTRAMHTSSRRKNRYIVCPTIVEPEVGHLVVDADSDRLVLWMRPEYQEIEHWRWWAYRLSDGAILGEIVPEQPSSTAEYQNLFVVDAIKLSGAPLVAAHWILMELGDTGVKEAARFALLDSQGKEVWRLNLDGEYDRPHESDPRWSHWYDLVRPGIKQLASTDRGFEVRSYKLEQRVAYTLACAADGTWTATEVSRVADALPLNEEEARTLQRKQAVAIETIDLPSAGVITLQLDERPLIGDVHNLIVGPGGHLAWIRTVPGTPGARELVIIDQQGKSRRRKTLEAGIAGSGLAALPDGKWLLWRSTYEGNEPTRVWVYDDSSDTLTETLIFPKGHIDRIIPRQDGSFLVCEGSISSVRTTLISSDGASIGSLLHAGSDRLALTTTGEIVTLSGLDTLVFHSSDGSARLEVRLSTVMAENPSYIASIAPAPAGAVYVGTSADLAPVVRIEPNGTMSAAFHPKRSNDAPFAARLASSADGSLWVTDGEAIYRLDKSGRAIATLGDQAGTRAIDGIGPVVPGPDNLIYAMGSRDTVIHAFSHDGTRARAIRPHHTLDARSGLAPAFCVRADGSLILSRERDINSFGAPPVDIINADGSDGGTIETVLDEFQETVLARPGRMDWWAIGYKNAALVNADGIPTEYIRKRPDGAWIATIDRFSVAPDGWLVMIVTGEPGLASSGASRFLCIYDADARPIATVPIPREDGYATSVGFAKAAVCACVGARVLLVSRDGASMRWFEIPGAVSGDWYFATTSADGSELWITKNGGHSIQRFALPLTLVDATSNHDEP